MLNYKKVKKIEELPFIPTDIFKKFEINSISKSETVKILKSSGTSGNPSKIFLDKINAHNQRKILGKIVADIIGKNRLPMLIIDKMFSKRKNLSTRELQLLMAFQFSGKNYSFY